MIWHALNYLCIGVARGRQFAINMQQYYDLLLLLTRAHYYYLFILIAAAVCTYWLFIILMAPCIAGRSICPFAVRKLPGGIIIYYCRPCYYLCRYYWLPFAVYYCLCFAVAVCSRIIDLHCICSPPAFEPFRLPALYCRSRLLPFILFIDYCIGHLHLLAGIIIIIAWIIQLLFKIIIINYYCDCRVV